MLEHLGLGGYLSCILRGFGAGVIIQGKSMCLLLLRLLCLWRWDRFELLGLLRFGSLANLFPW